MMPVGCSVTYGEPWDNFMSGRCTLWHWYLCLWCLELFYLCLLPFSFLNIFLLFVSVISLCTIILGILLLITLTSLTLDTSVIVLLDSLSIQDSRYLRSTKVKKMIRNYFSWESCNVYLRWQRFRGNTMMITSMCFALLITLIFECNNCVRLMFLSR